MTALRRRQRAAAALCFALILVVSAAVALAAGGCGAGGEAASGGALNVVAAESFLADIAQNVAGERFTVGTLIPRGTDPHSFEPTPKDLGEVAAADLVVINGGGLEGPLLKTLENAGGEATIVAASAGLQSRSPQAGEPPLESSEADPHFWLDPLLVKTYVATISEAFKKADPAGAATYAANAAAYTTRLEELDAWITSQVGTVPAADRKLVMNHASHGYYADRYGFSVVGTVIPSSSTGETPTAKQLGDLTAAIRASGAKAVFVEIDENPKLAEQIAAETGITVVDDLLDHSLTEPDGVAPTYVEMMKFDTQRIVEALRR
jgi:ABC-type Zn uptake system ZnuABC Zn-binding protein ZnuA